MHFLSFIGNKFYNDLQILWVYEMRTWFRFELCCADYPSDRLRLLATNFTMIYKFYECMKCALGLDLSCVAPIIQVIGYVIAMLCNDDKITIDHQPYVWFWISSLSTIFYLSFWGLKLYYDLMMSCRLYR